MAIMISSSKSIWDFFTDSKEKFTSYLDEFNLIWNTNHRFFHGWPLAAANYWTDCFENIFLISKLSFWRWCCTANRNHFILVLTCQINLRERKHVWDSIEGVEKRRTAKRKPHQAHIRRGEQKKQFLLLCASGKISTRINYNHFGCLSAIIFGLVINERPKCRTHMRPLDLFLTIKLYLCHAYLRYRLMSSNVRALILSERHTRYQKITIIKIRSSHSEFHIDRILPLWRRQTPSSIDADQSTYFHSMSCLRIDFGREANVLTYATAFVECSNGSLPHTGTCIFTL